MVQAICISFIQKPCGYSAPLPDKEVRQGTELISKTAHYLAQIWPHCYSVESTVALMKILLLAWTCQSPTVLTKALAWEFELSPLQVAVGSWFCLYFGRSGSLSLSLARALSLLKSLALILQSFNCSKHLEDLALLHPSLLLCTVCFCELLLFNW